MLDAVTVKTGSVTILDELSLTIRPGTPTVLIGPNGSGKTTLLRVLTGLQPISSGTLTFGGSRPMPEKIAIVFQRPVMLRRTAAANVNYALAAGGGATAERDSRIAELLALVGLGELAGRPARRLSGGEQQRLAIARALARDPTLLLLDEPAASLDPAATRMIEDIVRAVSARGVKVVMSTHNVGQARRLAGDIVVLNRGRLLEQGATADVLERSTNPDTARFIAGELLD